MQKNLAGGEIIQIGNWQKHTLIYMSMIVDPAIIIIPTPTRMVHRGASSADNASGDGAGVLLGLPHSYYSAILKYVEHFFSSQN